MVAEEAEVVAVDAGVAGAEPMVNEHPSLGVGLGFRPPFLADLFRNRRGVDFLEITADHYLDAPPEKLDELKLLADHFPIIPHALDLSIGSAEGMDDDYLEALAGLVERLNPPWWSEHLAFTRAGGVAIGHLAPLPRTREAVDVVARNVERIRGRIATPLILENITATIDLPGAELDEPEFLSMVLDQTGCGWLCDVTNLYTNAENRGRDPMAELDRWPWGRAVQFHFAGGHRQGGTMIDSHAHTTPPEVWRLLDEAARRAPVRGIILERDENLPPMADLLDELDRARAIARRYERWA